jgi:hypothetical protein
MSNDSQILELIPWVFTATPSNNPQTSWLVSVWSKHGLLSGSVPQHEDIFDKHFRDTNTLPVGSGVLSRSNRYTAVATHKGRE